MSREIQEQLPRGWAWAKLSEIAGINPSTRVAFEDEAAPVNFIPMRAVAPEGGGLTDPEVRPLREVRKGYTTFLSGDVIMAKITPCMENGKTTVVPDLPNSVCFGSTEFHVLRPELGIRASWISHFLLRHDLRRAAQRKMTGGVGQMRVPASFLEAVTVPVPPTAEQERISDALDEMLTDLDAGVEALKRAKAKLKLYRASVLRAAVTGDLTAGWRAVHPKLEPASVLLERILRDRRRLWEEKQLAKFQSSGRTPPPNWRAKYKEPSLPILASLPELPTTWSWATLEQLAWDSGYGTSTKCSATNEGLPVLRIPNISRGSLDISDLKFAPGTYSEPSEELVTRGDLLIIRTNGSRMLIGRGAVLKESPDRDYSYASYLIRFRLVPDSALLNWISLVWQSTLTRQWIEKRAATSAGQYNISLAVLASLPIPLPPAEEQEFIAELLDDQLSVSDHLHEDIDGKLKGLNGLRQATLKVAFEGSLVAQDSKDESADLLLVRIAEDRTEREAANRRKPIHQSVARKKRT